MKAVYIHIPFCKALCTYCDFPKMLYFKKYSLSYLKSLEHEMKSKYLGEEIETIYIGGGTPSVLDLSELTELFRIIKLIRLKKEYEFTIECNVNDINEEKIRLFKENGVNRISLGVQSFNQEVLKKMNRFHDYETVKEKVELIKKYSINNINIDLIYAFPNTSLEDVQSDLELAFSLGVSHISTYSLMIEPHTLLFINKVHNIPEEKDALMYELICKEMKKHGFIHYEISNFCLNGYECKHNLTYWNNLEYYGFGLGASGYIGNKRYTNTLSLDKYLMNDYFGSEEILTNKDKKVYELILGMRKVEGMNILDFNKKYHENILENSKIKALIALNELTVTDNNLKVPYDKLYIQNEILEELLDYE